MNRLAEYIMALILLLAAVACASGQMQGHFAPQPPPVVAVPQPPAVYDPPPVVYQPPPRLVPVQPQGIWVPVRRPTAIGNLLFGPVWTFVPSAPPPQQYDQQANQ